ncbi:hypothetical protein MGI18_10560 [Bacillus sp. OVS6]|nr:hypothetical protein MGI18_10560 [Bacillus sp. OVS6]
MDIAAKTIKYFTNYDKHYGVCLAESLEKSSQMSSSAAAEETLEKADKLGHEADPY